MLFAVGAVLVAGVLLASYLNNVNYACGNVTWPVVPTFLLVQAGFLGHWLLARRGEPLWIQYLPYIGTAAIGLWLMRFYVSVSHRPLGALLPLKLDWRLAVILFESSFWIYLCSLGNAIYRSTDALVINAGFELGTLTSYDANYRFCELAVFVAVTASYVSLPKITRWMASPESAEQDRVRKEMRRLNQFQAVLGCGAALTYIAGNNLLMKIWWLGSPNPVLPVPFLLQAAFALNVAITTSGDAGIQLSLRSGDKGLRTVGTVVGLTGLLKLGASLVAMKYASLAGIAFATVVSQSVLSLFAGAYICRHVKVNWVPWVLRSWLLPLVCISLAAWVRKLLPDTLGWVAALEGIFMVCLMGIALMMGIDFKFIREELAIVKGFWKK
jgi:O-antigen/teichoic acid export membrane protein